MDDLFGFLILGSLIALVVGLVKPGVFSRFVKNPTRKKVMLILGGLLFVSFIGLGMTADPKTSTNIPTEEAAQAETTNSTIPNSTPEEIITDKFLTHKDLLAMSSKPNEIIGKTFEMDLYLEQQPTDISAEFITQTDTNDINTILMTCNMKTSDLAKLDGASAQKAIYDKTYHVEVTFKEFNDLAGPYFKADCALK